DYTQEVVVIDAECPVIDKIIDIFFIRGLILNAFILQTSCDSICLHKHGVGAMRMNRFGKFINELLEDLPDVHSLVFIDEKCDKRTNAQHDDSSLKIAKL